MALFVVQSVMPVDNDGIPQTESKLKFRVYMFIIGFVFSID